MALIRTGGFASAFLILAAAFASPSNAQAQVLAQNETQAVAAVAAPAGWTLPAASAAPQTPAPQVVASVATAPVVTAPVAAAQPVAPQAAPKILPQPAITPQANPFGSLPVKFGTTTPAPAISYPRSKRSLDEMVMSYVNYGDQDAQQECLAKAVYFEARSEPLEGQLAVADVVLNRAASGKYPPTICDVVTQPWQFSFVNATRSIPEPNRNSRAWLTALAIADIARKNLAEVVPPNVLWYHANYVSPSWGRRLNRVTQIGLHIFYS